MFPNLRAEMARQDLTQEKLATAVGITTQTLNMKLRGKFKFTLNEAKKIKVALGWQRSIDELFEEKKEEEDNEEYG